MSADSVTRVTSKSWFGRIGNAVVGAIVGAILFLVAFPLLTWNEGRAIRTYKSLKEGAGVVVSVPAAPVEPANEGRLVHVTGRAETLESIQDPVFGVGASALKLRRRVEMYQWKESESRKTRKKLGGGEETVTTYTYSKTWDSKLIDSSRFQSSQDHRNPGRMEFAGHLVEARPVSLGDFTLSASLLGQLDDYRDLPLAGEYALPASLAAKVRREGDGLYVGHDAGNPQVGDLRIRFETVPPQEVSVVSRQKGASFEPYLAKAGGTVDLIECGIVSADLMFKAAQDANRMITWLIRLGGFLLMLVGLSLVLRPLSVLADVVPLFGSIVGFGTGLIAGVVAGVSALGTIAVAWLAYRPLLAGSLIAAAVALLLLLRRRRSAA